MYPPDIVQEQIDLEPDAAHVLRADAKERCNHSHGLPLALDPVAHSEHSVYTRTHARKYIHSHHEKALDSARTHNGFVVDYAVFACMCVRGPEVLADDFDSN